MQAHAIIFDLGGTLIDYTNAYNSWPEMETPGLTAAYNRLSQNGQVLPSLDRFKHAGFARLPGRWQAAMRGEQNLRLVDFLAEILADVGVTAVSNPQLNQAATAYETAFCREARAITGGEALLSQIRAAGVKIGLLSNTMFTGAAHIADLRRFGLDGFFDAMLFSADVNKWKPQPDPYLHVAAELGVEPETAVFVGDHPEHDIPGAQQAGMKAVHFQSHQRYAPNDVVPDGRILRLEDLLPLLSRW